MRVKRTIRAVQSVQPVEFNKQVFLVGIGSRQRHLLPSHRIGVPLAVFPDIQQPISVGVLDGGAQDHGPPGDTPAVGRRWQYRSRLGSIGGFDVSEVTQYPGWVVPATVTTREWRQ